MPQTASAGASGARRLAVAAALVLPLRALLLLSLLCPLGASAQALSPGTGPVQRINALRAATYWPRLTFWKYGLLKTTCPPGAAKAWTAPAVVRAAG